MAWFSAQTSGTSATSTWTEWNIVYTNNTVTGTTAGVWDNWNDVYTASNTAISGTTVTWTSWCTNGTISLQGGSWQPRELTPEERAAETERLRIAAEEAKARQEAARLAVEKAEALLQAHLDEEQQAMLKREQAFLVSVKSGRKYKVKRGQRGNVQELDATGQAVRQFCIHPDDVPDQDAMLAQKLLLEHDEPAFRRIANITELRRAS